MVPVHWLLLFNLSNFSFCFIVYTNITLSQLSSLLDYLLIRANQLTTRVPLKFDVKQFYAWICIDGQLRHNKIGRGTHGTHLEHYEKWDPYTLVVDALLLSPLTYLRLERFFYGFCDACNSYILIGPRHLGN